MTVWLELAIVVGLILLNGFFAMAELAIAVVATHPPAADGGSRHHAAPHARWHSPKIPDAFCPVSRSASR